MPETVKDYEFPWCMVDKYSKQLLLMNHFKHSFWKEILAEIGVKDFFPTFWLTYCVTSLLCHNPWWHLDFVTSLLCHKPWWHHYLVTIRTDIITVSHSMMTLLLCHTPWWHHYCVTSLLCHNPWWHHYCVTSMPSWDTNIQPIS